MQDERAATLDWPSGASVQRLVDWFVETEGSKAKNQDRFFCNVDAIMDVVSRCHADVLVLNEFVPIRDTSLLPKVGERLAQMGYTYSTLASSPSWMHVTFVTVIFSRVPFQQTQAEEQIGLFGDRHAVRVSVLLDNRLLHVFGLHLDVYDEAGTARLKQAQQVISKIGTLENVVIAGDLNSLRRRDYCTADWEKIVEHDKLRGVAADCKTIDFLEANGFSDCFAMDPPSCSTWSGRRVDFLLLKGAIESKQAFVVHSAASDHIPIVADLVLKK